MGKKTANGTVMFITNVPEDVKTDLENIAANTGIPLSALVKPKLVELRDSHPEKMRMKRNNKD